MESYLQVLPNDIINRISKFLEPTLEFNLTTVRTFCNSVVRCEQNNFCLLCRYRVNLETKYESVSTNVVLNYFSPWEWKKCNADLKNQNLKNLHLLRIENGFFFRNGGIIGFKIEGKAFDKLLEFLKDATSKPLHSFT